MMLLDTHTFAWWLWSDDRLSLTARRLIEGSPGNVLVSAVSAWEVAFKYRLGKWPRAAILARNFETLAEEQGFALISITAAQGRIGGMMESNYKDPFDRLLAAQAISLGIVLVSNDAKLTALGAATAW